jgi:hypothetical protein
LELKIEELKQELIDIIDLKVKEIKYNTHTEKEDK